MAKVAVKQSTTKLKRPAAKPTINIKPQSPIEKSSKNTPENAQHLTPHRFGPGNCANPAGRPKGSRNKLAESFVADMLADWEQAGASAIQRVRIEDPSTYLRVVAGLVPKEFNIGSKGKSNLEAVIEQFTDEQLAELDLALRAISATTVKSG